MNCQYWTVGPQRAALLVRARGAELVVVSATSAATPTESTCTPYTRSGSTLSGNTVADDTICSRGDPSPTCRSSASPPRCHENHRSSMVTMNARRGRSKGFAIVAFSVPSNASRALESLTEVESPEAMPLAGERDDGSGHSCQVASYDRHDVVRKIGGFGALGRFLD